MAAVATQLTRESTTESHILSNIDVDMASATSASASIDIDAEAPASTPPTSISDSRSMESMKVEDAAVSNSGGRPKRVRSGVTNYNLKALSEAQLPMSKISGSRNASGLSGRTLVNRADLAEEDDEDEAEPFVAKIDKALNPDWELPAGSPKGKGKSPARVQRRPSVKDRVKDSVKEASKKAVGKAGSLRSVLGKRGRDMMESGKRALGMAEEAPSPAKSKLLKELDLGGGGLLDELDLDVELPAPRPAKRAKTSTSAPLQELAQPTGPLQKTSDGKRVKKWQTEGLFVGQDANFDPARKGSKKLQKKRPASSNSNIENQEEDQPATKKQNAMNFSLPMFDYLEKNRDFTIPFDVFAPSLKKGDERPKDWYKINRNRLVGEAKELWEKSEKLPTSACVCRPPADGESGCDYDCLNRVMQYECNDKNCNLDPAMCNNRAFAQLAARTKKGGAFDVGVEVVKTDQRGFGVRACRSFSPGQIIMEYTGEIISEGECQRRMREDYKDKACYYLMELEKNLVIDGTKGSMARFINHSCSPNCEVRMVKVNGTPRMAVFSGDGGIMTGEELTYDYNFDNFGDAAQKCYCGAANCRGTLSRRLNASELKKQKAVDEARRKLAAEAAAKAQREEEKKKEVKKERGSGWRGWVAVDDPETKARLKAEKAAKEEAEKNSVRAARLARRRGSMGAAEVTEKPAKVDAKRRKTMNGIVATSSARQSEDTRRSTSLRRTSTGSKFTEDLAEGEQRPTSKRSTITKKTTVSVPIISESSGDDEIAVSPPTKPAAAKPQVAVQEITAGAEEDEDDEDVVMSDLVAPKAKEVKRNNSIRGRIEKAVGKAVGKAGSASGGLRQSTLNFGKK